MVVAQPALPLTYRRPVPWRVASAAICRRLDVGEMAGGCGGRPAPVVIVERGMLLVARHEACGRRSVIDVLGYGDVHGLEAVRAGSDLLFRDEAPPYEWEASALVPSRVLAISPGDVRAAIDRDPAVRAWATERMAESLERARHFLGVMLTSRVCDRLLAVLTSLAERFGERSGKGVLVDAPLTQDLLAGMVGATRESVNRAVGELEGTGRISRRGLFYVVSGEGSGPWDAGPP